MMWILISDQAPLVWRAPEGPEGTGGLRGAAPNEVRPPSLAGGRGLRRPEHPWGHKQHKQEGSRPRAHRAARTSRAHRAAWPASTPRDARNISGTTETCDKHSHAHTETGRRRLGATREAHDARLMPPRSGNSTQEEKPQKRNEKHPLTHRHSQLHSNTPKSHMGNMRAS